tara:strand:+ start:42489 stop:43178 length:690 start_codon:yes stop_codon:yes gene_type:complete
MANFACAQNLIVNGDFEDPGLLGVNSAYTHTPGGNIIEGSWWITPWDPGTPWDFRQHTPGGVAAMNVNGDDSGIAGIRRVWYQTVEVTVGRTYRFSVWALGTAAGAGAYSLRLDVDDEAISGVFSPSAPRVYTEHTAEFVAKTSTVEVSIKNVSGITFPNDFMLDDLSLEEVAVCAADLTNDGELDFFDVSAFLDAFSQHDPIADFTGDGDFDFFDVSDFLDAFAIGCP